jgi:hypothetical protein
MTTTAIHPDAPRGAIRLTQLRAAHREMDRLVSSPWLTDADRQALAERLIGK